jgi:hypothetical protein
MIINKNQNGHDFFYKKVRMIIKVKYKIRWTICKYNGKFNILVVLVVILDFLFQNLQPMVSRYVIISPRTKTKTCQKLKPNNTTIDQCCLVSAMVRTHLLSKVQGKMRTQVDTTQRKKQKQTINKKSGKDFMQRRPLTFGSC